MSIREYIKQGLLVCLVCLILGLFFVGVVVAWAVADRIIWIRQLLIK